MMRTYETRTVTIPSGDTASNAVERAGYAFGGGQFPAAMTSTEITIQVSNSSDASTFKAVTAYSGQDANTKQAAIPFGASENFQLWVETSAFRYFRFVGDASEAADREFTVYLSD